MEATWRVLFFYLSVIRTLHFEKRRQGLAVAVGVYRMTLEPARGRVGVPLRFSNTCFSAALDVGCESRPGFPTWHYLGSSVVEPGQTRLGRLGVASRMRLLGLTRLIGS